MKYAFFSMLNRLNAKGDYNSVYNSLQKNYDGFLGRYREYHNISHIENCLIDFLPARKLSKNSDTVEFAIWYHDAIYVPGESNNEEKSVEFAKESCEQLKISKTFANKVEKLILATKHNVLSETIDEKLIVDCDLSIFGRSTSEFKEYEKNIRKEYYFVKEEDFCKGRIAVLQSFLDRDNIYSTPLFKRKYKSKARRNLEMSIMELANRAF